MDEETICQKVEQFFAQVKTYRELRVEFLANYVGIDAKALLRVFSRREWQRRKDAWTLQRLREAMDEIYPSAKIQKDFSARRLARAVGVDPDVLHRLVGDEFQQRLATLPASHYDEKFIRPALEQYFGQVSAYEELRLRHFARFVGLDITSVIHILQRTFPPQEWQRRKDEWSFQRLRTAMDEIAQEAQTQADFSVERILVRAGIPHADFRRLAKDEFLQQSAALTIKLASEEALRQKEVEERLRQAAAHFFAQAEEYRKVTVEQFALFAGQDLQTVTRVYPAQRWKAMRDEWALEWVRKAMDGVYREARFQSDFSAQRVAEKAGVHPNVLSRLARDEYYRRRATLPTEPEKVYRRVGPRKVALPMKPEELEILHRKVQQSFSQAETYVDLRAENLASSVGTSPSTLLRSFPPHQLQMMRDEWCLQRIQLAMDEVYRASTLKVDFTKTRIAEKAGVPIGTIERLTSEEFRRRRATLPNALEKLLAVLKTLVEANTPLANFTQERVYELAGVGPGATLKEFMQAYREAYMELVQRQSRLPLGPTPPPTGEHDPYHFAGKWIDLASQCWDLRQKGSRGSILRRDRLRDDLAEMAWSLLRQDIRSRSGDLSPKTIAEHYNGFIHAGVLLGDDNPDISLISLEKLQLAWHRYSGTHYQRKVARMALLRLVTYLLATSEHDVTHDSCQELLRISVWFGRFATVPADKPGEEFLSDAELTRLLQSCLADVQRGIAFAANNPDLLLMDTRRRPTENAYLVVQWGVALAVLLMAFTGLRSQSVVLLEIEDWIQLRPGLFGLVWRHGKKREENLAVLPALLAHQLDLYVSHTAAIRKALGTQRVFLNGTTQGLWNAMSSSTFTGRLNRLAKHHSLEQNGDPLLLGSTLLRRTFTTRALYEGQSIEALRIQLGHAHTETTYIYAHFDRSEHPDQVREPLDLYGRQSLTLWHAPLILDQLPSEKRLALLDVKAEREQDVGYCSHNRCIKAERGSPPPCSLCEHLVTGPEFLKAWEGEEAQRAHKLQQLAATPDAGLLLAQMKCQFEHFQANFAFVRKSCNL